jgi:hypothetical protein
VDDLDRFAHNTLRYEEVGTRFASVLRCEAPKANPGGMHFIVIDSVTRYQEHQRSQQDLDVQP